MQLLVVWLLHALALLAVAYILPSIDVSGPIHALVAAALIALVNILVRPIFVLFTLPVTLLTLGLFILVINGLLFYLVGAVLEGFEVRSVWSGILGAVLYSLISWALSALVFGNKNT